MCQASLGSCIMQSDTASDCPTLTASAIGEGAVLLIYETNSGRDQKHVVQRYFVFARHIIRHSIQQEIQR